MKRLLICCAAMAFWAVDQTELAAQSSSRTGSYQSILAQSGVSGYNQSSSYGGNSYDSYSSQGFAPGNSGGNAGYQQAASPAMTGQAPATSGTVPAMKQCEGQMAPVPSPMGGGGGCNSGCGVGPMVQGQAAGLGGPAYGGSGYASAGSYSDAPVYSPGCDIGFDTGPKRNYFYGLNGLIFDRDYEDDLFITRNPAGDILLSTDADSGTLAGLEFFLGSRGANGSGWEARYWGLFADEATATLTGVSHSTYITGLQDITWPSTGEDLRTVVDRGTSNTITRDNEIHNVELSMLRRGGCYKTRFGKSANYEVLAGFRWFEFDEEFRWDINGPAAPIDLTLANDVDNTLLGFQMGGRTEVCLGQRLRFNVATKGGVYNNRARVSQVITDNLGVYGQAAGADYNYSDAKNDLSFLGELDMGLSFNVSQCSRLVTGYRVIGVSGIALAPDQFNNFNAVAAIRDVQSNGDLLLHGAFFGLEFCR